MLSNISLTDPALESNASFKKGHERYAVYKLNNLGSKGMQVDIETVGHRDDTTHEHFLQALPSNECRMAFVNVEYLEGLGQRCKAIYVLWCPQDAPHKEKMICATIAVSLKAKLGITALNVQCGSTEAIQLDTLIEKCRAAYD